MLTAGGSFTCVVIDGGAQCWGENESGQNGNGTFAGNAPILPVVGITGGIQAISSGDQNSTCAIIDGAIWCWGYNGYGELGDGTNNDSRDAPVAVVFPSTQSGPP